MCADPTTVIRNGNIYLRADNPGFEAVETVLSALEEGAASLVFASGMAAATAVFQALKPGDHVVAPEIMYWALRNWLAGHASDWGLEVDFVPADSLEAIRAAVRPGKTKLLWIETPANPTWAITDIAAAAEIAHRPPAQGSPSTRPSPRPSSPGRSPWARTSSCIRRPST